MMLLVEKLEKGPSDIFSFNWNNFIFSATHLWFVLWELSADEGEQNNILGTDNCDTNDTIVTSEVIGNQIFDSNIKVRLWTVIWKIRVLGECYCLVVIDHHWLGVTRLHCCVPGLQCSLIQKIFDSCSCTTHNEVSQSSGEISQMFIIKYLVKWLSCILQILDQILIKSSVITAEHVVNPPRLNFSRNPKSENYLRNNK